MNKRVILMALVLLAAMLGMSAQETRKEPRSFMMRFQEGLKIIKDGDYSKARDIFNELLPYADSTMTARLAYNLVVPGINNTSLS